MPELAPLLGVVEVLPQRAAFVLAEAERLEAREALVRLHGAS